MDNRTMTFLTSFLEQDKKEVRKQIDTESESQDKENENSITFEKQYQDRLTSINKIQSYFEFLNILEVAKKENQQNKIIESIENVIQTLQKETKLSRNEGQTKDILLRKNQQKFLSDLQRKFKIDIEKQIISTGRFKKSLIFTKQLIIHEVQSSKSHEIIKIQVQLMWYQTEICILNEFGSNPLFKSSRAAGSGAFGNVYFTKIFGNFIAVKCISIENLEKEKKSNEFDLSKLSNNCLEVMNGLKEFFFVLLFSELQIGPQVETIGGFDMIIYQDSIAFATEICSKSKFNGEINDLKSNLFRMHMLQIVHRDIKPVNIMYSERYKKNVFIDFGCAQVLDAKIGEKSVAHFAGTTTFCSQEVLLLLNDKERLVDLYFNDVFGLRKCITQFTSSQIFISESKQNISETFEIESISLKHSLYLQDYKKFNSKWELIRKKCPQNLQEIQRRLLYFFKDLKPNESLRRFYWEELRSDTKESIEYNDLEIVLKTQHSKFFFYLDIDRSKVDALEMRRILFTKLKIELSDIPLKQKQIKLCLIDRVTMKKEILALLSKISHYDFKSKEMWNKIRDNFEKFCILICHYSSLLEGSSETSHEQKIEMCRQVLKIVQKIQDSSLNEIQIMFQCPIQFFEPMSQFYQYFLFKIFPNISRNLKQITLIRSLSNISLLGYPLSNLSYTNYLLHHLVYLGSSASDLQEISDEQRIQRINNYWESKICLLLFNNMLYGSNINWLLVKLTQQNNKQFLINIEKFMIFKKGENSLFFDFNYRFVNSLVFQFSQFAENKLEDIIQILHSTELQEMVKSNKLIKKWRKLVTFSISYISTLIQLKNKSQVLKLLQKQDIFECQKNYSILPFLIYFYLEQIILVKVQFRHIFKKIDEVINNQDISLRFELHKRHQIALKILNFEQIKQIVKFITNQLSAVIRQKKSLNFMNVILIDIINFFTRYLKKVSNINEQLLFLLNIYYPVVDLAMKMGKSYYQTKQHLQFMSSNKQLHSQSFTIYQFEQQVLQRQMIKQFSMQLTLMGEMYHKVQYIARQHDERLSLDFAQINDNKIKTEKIFQPRKITFPKNHIVFVEELRRQMNLSEDDGSWLQMFYLNKGIQRQARKHRNIAIRLAKIIRKWCRNKEQIYMCQQIIRQLFNQIHVDKFDQLLEYSNLPTLSILYDYILIQLVKSKYDSHWCTQMIKLFNACWEKKFMQRLFEKSCCLHYIFNCFVYLNSSFREIKILLSRFSLFLREAPQDKYIQSINEVLSHMFWCDCINCFPRKPQNWDKYVFSMYLSQTINQEEEIENPYMSMVYYYVMKKKTLNPDIIRKFVIFILRSMNHVVFSVREIIMQGLLFYVIYSMYSRKIQQNDFIETYPLNYNPKQTVLKHNDFNIHFIEKRFISFVFQLIFFNQNPSLIHETRFRKITKQQRKKSSNQKLLYYYGKIIKNNSYRNEQLGSVLQIRFFKEQHVENYHYPLFVKQAYARKMRKYHELKQNYDQTESFIKLARIKQISL